MIKEPESYRKNPDKGKTRIVALNINITKKIYAQHTVRLVTYATSLTTL